ncbi:MAG TPA: hypothetical protein VII56_04840 [Rhizomicrobium sp.]
MTKDDHSCDPKKIQITVKQVLDQVGRDLFDKEVASAATYSYLWIADQMGHIGLGLVVVFLASWILYFLNLPTAPDSYWPLYIGAAAVSYWEFSAYRTYAAMTTGLFPAGKLLLARNAVIAAFYMVAGVVAGFAWQGGELMAAVVTLSLVPALVILAFPWLRQKIVWQKAGLPFLFRLSNASPTISRSDARDLQNLIEAQIKESRRNMDAVPGGPVIILSGPLGAGKTSMACGIGTECAFGDVKVRYTTFEKLLQMAPPPADDPGPSNIIYWPWRDSELLIVDDIDTETKTTLDVDVKTFCDLVDRVFGNEEHCLGRRTTVWVLGPKKSADLAKWSDAIGKICAKGQERPPQVLAIEFTPPPPAPAPIKPAPTTPVLSTSLVGKVSRIAGWAIVVLSTLLLATSLWWLGAERGWDSRADLSEPDAFRYGTLGLELAPYKLVAVLDQLGGDAFKRIPPGGGAPMNTGHWWSDFGFNAGGPPTPSKKCPLPLGFSISSLLPQSATPVPVDFAGLTCAACHSQRVHTAPQFGGVDRVVVGAGMTATDVIGFGDALKQAVANPALTADLIQTTYAKQCGESEGFWQRVIGDKVEAIFISQWISGFRATTLSDSSKYDLPFHGTALLEAGGIGAGPARTRPFRSVVRNNLDFPGATNLAYSKPPAIFEQSRDLRPQSQYDGSIVDTVTRSLIAAYTSGATQAALNREPIAHNVRAAAHYTETLGPRNEVPTFAKLFPAVSAGDPATLAQGETVYMAHCASCHGHRRADGTWDVVTGASAIHRTAPLSQMGTDPARVTFRYAEILPLSLWLAFPGSPEPLPAAQRGPVCDGKTQELPAGYDALAQQRTALDYLKVFAGFSGDNVLYQYWAGRRTDDFEQARREFPAGHALAFGPKLVCYDTTHLGYYNNPIPVAYLRAPYLHNASVPTMRELLNLDERPAQFCRGNNLYDPVTMGLVAETPAAGAHCGAPTPFLFDTTLPGNSNAGHDYPWTRAQVAADPNLKADLEALIVYLRTQ